MLSFFQPEALFTGKAQFKKISHKNLLSAKHKSNKNRAVVVFAHHRDVKVALDELNYAGFSYDSLTLIARQAQRCLDDSGLITNSYFDPQKFDFNQVSQKFFLRLFKRGKYLVLVKASEHDVNAASKIMSCRRDRAEVWRFEQFAAKD